MQKLVGNSHKSQEKESHMSTLSNSHFVNPELSLEFIQVGLEEVSYLEIAQRVIRKGRKLYYSLFNDWKRIFLKKNRSLKSLTKKQRTNIYKVYFYEFFNRVIRELGERMSSSDIAMICWGNYSLGGGVILSFLPA